MVEYVFFIYLHLLCIDLNLYASSHKDVISKNVVGCLGCAGWTSVAEGKNRKSFAGIPY